MVPETHPFFRNAPRPRVLAHRGLLTDRMAADGLAENSVAALAAADAAGVDYIESDCHATSDGEVVLFHDEDLRRVTGDPRRVADVSVSDLTELMASRGGLATLAQALEGFPEQRFNIDVKASAAAESAGRIIAKHADRVLLTSFSDTRRRAALRAAAAAGGIPATSPGSRRIAILVFLTRLLPLGLLLDRAFRGVDALQIPERRGRLRILTPRLIRAAHQRDVEVHVWTVNDPARMRHLVALGVDGIVTDRADVALAELHE